MNLSLFGGNNEYNANLLLTTATAEFSYRVKSVRLDCAGRSILGAGLADWSTHIWRRHSALLPDEAETNDHRRDARAALFTVCTRRESCCLAFTYLLCS